MFTHDLHSQTPKSNEGWEIIAHRASLQVYPAQNTISCTDTITVKRTRDDLEELKLGFLPVYTIRALSVNGKNIDPHRSRDVVLIDHLPSDSVFPIILSYHGALSFRSEFSQLTNTRAVFREEEILPHGPNALGFVRFSITVPKDWEAIACGRLIAKEMTTDSAHFTWEFDQPIPNIGWICAGKFFSRDSVGASAPISVHLFDEDSTAASTLMKLAGDVLSFYGERFSPYRFPRLTIIEVEDWVAGRNVLAIAVPSFIMVKKLAFTTDDRFNQYSSIVPHEIAHQWWPATVFINDEDAAFLSEGMCEYSALMFAQSHGTMTLRDSLDHHPLLRPLMMRIQQGRDVPLQQKADLRALPTQYLKASFVHNMLRHLLGEHNFNRLYHEYVKRFAAKTAGLSDFQSLAEELSGLKLDWFFDQWVKKRGIPRLKLYNVKSTHKENAWTTTGRVRMVGYDKYTTKIDVGVVAFDGNMSTSVWLGADSSGAYRNDVPFSITSSTKPRQAILDPAGDVLKVRKLPPKLSDVREPSDGLMVVGTQLHEEHLLQMARKDSMAMDRGGWSITIKRDTQVTLGDLQRERVFLYGRATENRVVAEVENKFPYGFRGDSALVKGETVFDSTLTLFQVIDNPFIAQGIMCWIAPLTDRSEAELLPFDASWSLVRGKDEVSSGTWDVKDEDVVVEIR